MKLNKKTALFFGFALMSYMIILMGGLPIPYRIEVSYKDLSFDELKKI